MNSGNPRHTYNDKNFREASVKIGVLYGVYSAYPLILIQTVSPQHLPPILKFQSTHFRESLLKLFKTQLLSMFTAFLNPTIFQIPL